jgi:hypothetical protein
MFLRKGRKTFPFGRQCGSKRRFDCNEEEVVEMVRCGSLALVMIHTIGFTKRESGDTVSQERKPDRILRDKGKRRQ